MRQANLARSRAGVIRGLHYHERGQDDLFCCLEGMVRVVVLDRETGETFTEDIGDENPVAIYVPGIHAHGYEALTDCLFCYFVTEEYDPADPDEHGVAWNDPRVVDLWSTRSPILSERDQRPRRRNRRGRPARPRAARGVPGRRGADARRVGRDAPAAGRVSTADLVLHAAAWTDVDGAEDDPQSAAAVNVGGVQHAAELGAPLVVWSSDYVFDGSKREPYVESDAPSPLGAYGRTKLHGEAAAGEQAWVVRTSWLFGPTSKNFVRTMLRLGAERDEVAVVDDQRGSPTYVGHLAEATKAVLELPLRRLPRRRGAATAPGPTSPRRSSRRRASDPRPPDHDRRVRRQGAAAGVLGAAQRTGAPELPHWREGLRECLHRLGTL